MFIATTFARINSKLYCLGCYVIITSLKENGLLHVLGNIFCPFVVQHQSSCLLILGWPLWHDVLVNGYLYMRICWTSGFREPIFSWLHHQPALLSTSRSTQNKQWCCLKSSGVDTKSSWLRPSRNHYTQWIWFNFVCKSINSHVTDLTKLSFFYPLSVWKDI